MKKTMVEILEMVLFKENVGYMIIAFDGFKFLDILCIFIFMFY